MQCERVDVMSQAAAERLWQDRQEWEAGEAGRQAAAARAEAVAEREAALQRDLARLVRPSILTTYDSALMHSLLCTTDSARLWLHRLGTWQVDPRQAQERTPSGNVLTYRSGLHQAGGQGHRTGRGGSRAQGGSRRGVGTRGRACSPDGGACRSGS